MKNENIDNLFKELVIVGIIFMSICFGLQSLQHTQELERMHKLVEVERTAKIEAMKIAIELNNATESYIEMLHSMNRYADEVDNELKHIYHTQQLIKDLRFSR